jgi:hypothetical protein
MALATAAKALGIEGDVNWHPDRAVWLTDEPRRCLDRRERVIGSSLRYLSQTSSRR